MKLSKFITVWGINVIIIFVLDFLWHTILFGGLYGGLSNSLGFRIVDGKIEPLLGYIILAEILIGLGAAYFLSLSSSRIRDGIVYSVVTVGFLGLINHAILLNWPLTIVDLDLIFAIIVGAAVGFTMTKTQA